MFRIPGKKTCGGWEKLHSDNDKENYRPDFVSSSPTSLSSLSSSSSNMHRSPIRDSNNKVTFVIQETKNLRSNNDISDGTDSFSSGYETWKTWKKSPSPPPPPFKVHEDEISRSFDSLLFPFQSYGTRNDNSSIASNSPPSIAYSPLSSFTFADPSNLPSAFYSDFDFGEPPFCFMHHVTNIFLLFRRFLNGESRTKIAARRSSARFRHEWTDNGDQRSFLRSRGIFNADNSSKNAANERIVSAQRILQSPECVLSSTATTHALSAAATAINSFQKTIAAAQEIQAQQKVTGRCE